MISPVTNSSTQPWPVNWRHCPGLTGRCLSHDPLSINVIALDFYFLLLYERSIYTHSSHFSHKLNCRVEFWLWYPLSCSTRAGIATHSQLSRLLPSLSSSCSSIGGTSDKIITSDGIVSADILYLAVLTPSLHCGVGCALREDHL